MYSVAMANAMSLVPDPDEHGGYLTAFVRDHLNGQASWGARWCAKVFRTRVDAIAVALLVGTHSGVGQPVILSARTQERVQ